MVLTPSIASANPLVIGEILNSLDPWPYLHIDIEDGNFVPNITFGMKTVRAICSKARNKQIQVHLMVNHPEDYLEELAVCGVNCVVAQIEALNYPMQFLNRCRALGMKAGLALNMKTSIEDTKIFWNVMDQILLMTSEPDSAGEELYKPALERAMNLASRPHNGLELYVDGGLTKEALCQLSNVEVDGAVLGRLVFQSPNPLETLQEIKGYISNEIG